MRQGHAPIERDQVKEDRIDQFAAQGRSHDARPKPTTLGPDFHLRQHIAVNEGAAKKCRDRGHHDARRVAEDGFHGRLGSPRCIGRRQMHHHRRHQGGKSQGGEARPNDAPVAPVTIHFSENIAENVRNREEQNPVEKGHAAAERQRNGGLFGRANQIGTQQDAHVRRHHEIVVFELAVVRRWVHGDRRVAVRHPILPAMCNTGWTAAPTGAFWRRHHIRGGPSTVDIRSYTSSSGFMEQGKPLMQSDSPLVDFNVVCEKVRAAVEPNRTHAVSLHDEAGDVLWLSESSMGPDEHNAVREAAEAFTNPAAAPILSFDLGDSRSAVMVRAVNARRAIVGLVMIVMDTRIVSQGAPKLMTPKLQRALVQFAGMRPDRAPAAPPEPLPSPRAPTPAPEASRSAPPKAARTPSAPSAAAPLSVGPRTIAAQLEQIVSRGTVRTHTLDPATVSRPASYVSHVGAARTASASSAPSAPHAASAPHVASASRAASPSHAPRPVAPPSAPARPAVAVEPPAEELAEKQPAHKGVPPEIDRLN